MRGPLAAAAVVACYMAVVALMEIWRDRRRSTRGVSGGRTWWRRMGRFFGPYPAPAIIGWGALVSLGGANATFGEYAAILGLGTATFLPVGFAIAVLFKRRFGTALPEGGLSQMTPGMKRFVVAATLVGVAPMVGVLAAADAASWLDLNL